ncbi:MAG: hypothetical protein JWO12_1862 [Frankiales bacterium]|nr:hypothetical protein [Frankiales bacterium]
MEAFGPYEVLQQVAVGSTATVFRARHVELGREAAIKLLHPALLAVPGARERFRSEAQMLSSLDDPHVVAVYELGEDAERVWIAQEWVVGASLEAVLAAHGRLTPEQALGALRGALQGLAHAHERGLLHRDIAPQNVLTDMAGSTKLVDFGLAAPVGASGACGTPAFVSPEAARGEALGKPSDVYSSAAVLYLLLAGVPPFPGADPATVLRRHQDDPVPKLEGPPPLADVVSRAMAKDPGRRPPDAAALLAELEDAAERSYGADWLTRAAFGALVTAAVKLGLGTEGPAPAAVASSATSVAMDTGVVATPPRPKRRRVAKAPALAVAAVVLLGGGAATAVTLSAKSSPKAAAPRPSAAPRPTPSPTVSLIPSPAPTLVAAAAPQGTYDLSIVLTKSDNPIQPTGTKLTGTWTVLTTCVAVPCTGTVTSTSGASYTTTWDGTTLTLAGTRESPCLDRTTNQPIAGTEGAYHEDIRGTLRATPDPKDPPTTLSGVLTAVQTLAHPSSICHGTPPTHQTRQTVIRKLSR